MLGKRRAKLALFFCIVSSLCFPLCAQEFSLGAFRLTIAKDRKSLPSFAIAYRNTPERSIYETPSGMPFVELLEGRTVFHTKHGMFNLETDARPVCREPFLKNTIVEQEHIQFNGGFDDCDAKLTVVFRVLSAARIGFEVYVESGQRPKSIHSIVLHQTMADKHVYGLGTQYTYFDLKGRRVPVVIQEQGHGRGEPFITPLANLLGAGGDWSTTYAAVPYYITSSNRALHLENSEYSTFDFSSRTRTSIEVHSSSVKASLWAAKDPLSLIETYTSQISGRMKPLPDWINEGAIIAIQGGTDAVLEKVQRLKTIQLPLGGVWLQDWVGERKNIGGRQIVWNWQLDKERYPRWKQLVTKLKKDGIRVLGYINPMLVDAQQATAKRNLHDEGVVRDFFANGSDGKPISIFLAFYSKMVDFRKPDAWQWFKEIIRENLIGNGMSGWMADYGECFPMDARSEEGIQASAYHNTYASDWAAVNREAIRDAGQDDEIVPFFRAGHTKSPGEARLFWLGDQLPTWDEFDGLASTITGLVSSGLSGFALNHSDIGGFMSINLGVKNYRRTRELFLRWAELNAFTPVFRTHEGYNPEANHQFDSDPETLFIFGHYARVFKSLAPYRKALMKEAWEKGYPLVRHPLLHYPEDERLTSLRHAFMLGMDLYVVPVIQSGARTVSVVFPKRLKTSQDAWIHLWSGKTYSGGTSATVSAPLGMPAVFVRKTALHRKELQRLISLASSHGRGWRAQ